MKKEHYKTIVNHYSNYNEDSRFDTRWCSTEYLTTLHYIHRYIQPQHQVLEIGAGTGRYSLKLASEGYNVTAIELVDHNLDVLKSKITAAMNIQAEQGDALDLSRFPDNTFDLTLLLGPMYHLFAEADKLQALNEAIRVTKPGGIIMVAYCITDGPMVNFIFRTGRYHEMVARGFVNRDTLELRCDNGFVFEHVRKADVDKLMQKFHITRLHYVATDGLVSFLQKELDTMDEDTFAALLRYHFTVCESENLADATAHSLDIFRKEG